MSTVELFGAVVSQVLLVPFQVVQFVCFWVSVSLPFVYIPLLYNGMEPGMGIFVSLLALHVVSLVLGHGYGRDRDEVDANATA